MFRHGHVANHQGDVSLLPEGRHVAFNAGVSLADQVADGVAVTILFSPSARTRETAEELARGLAGGLSSQNKPGARVLQPQPEEAIRNFQFIVDGREMMPTDGMHASLPPSAEHDPFFQAFWQDQDDPIDYWLTHPSQSAEQPVAVAARMRTFFGSLLQFPFPGIFLLVTHSGPMRAFLREALGADPGEPEFCEAFQVNANETLFRRQRAHFSISQPP